MYSKDVKKEKKEHTVEGDDEETSFETKSSGSDENSMVAKCAL